jgi:hypothetical protein
MTFKLRQDALVFHRKFVATSGASKRCQPRIRTSGASSRTSRVAPNSSRSVYMMWMSISAASAPWRRIMV